MPVETVGVLFIISVTEGSNGANTSILSTTFSNLVYLFKVPVSHESNKCSCLPLSTGHGTYGSIRQTFSTDQVVHNCLWLNFKVSYLSIYT